MAPRGLVHLTLCALAAACITSSVIARKEEGKPKTLLVFGDSLSDQNNVWLASNKTVPNPLGRYWNGRYCNANGNWVDYITRNSASQLRIANFAYGGALMCTRVTGNIFADRVPSLVSQVSLYKQRMSTNATFAATLNNTQVAVVFGGGNDFIVASAMPSAAAAILGGVVNCTVATVTQLLMSGVKVVVVANQAPLHLTPLALAGTPAGRAGLLAAEDQVNAGIAQVVAGLNKVAMATNQSVLLWDVSTVIRNTIANATAAGFKYSNVSCVTYAPEDGSTGGKPLSLCKKPDEYVFYDPIHPTAKSHTVIGKSLRALLVKYKIIKA